MDNLLYTYCADGNVRVWAHTDHHAVCVLQKIITLDTNASIQPRRMSMNSISKSRFSFVLQSRDLARATERAIQTARSGIDHALEHLVEVANRSPEICVILDGLGHMSAWGIENVGFKSKASPEKFNVALVDGVNITLPKEMHDNNSVQIVAFANNDAAASLCVLVHSFAGQIDWYQGSFVSFFDTGTKRDRLDYQACWSGHDSVIDKMISGPNYQDFLSLTEDDQVIYWSLSSNATPTRICDLQFDSPIIDATFLGDTGYVAILQDDQVSLWKLNTSTPKLLGKCALAHTDAVAISSLKTTDSHDVLRLNVLFEGNRIQNFEAHLTSQDSKIQTNGFHKPISALRTGNLPVSKNFNSACFGVQSRLGADLASRNLLTWSDPGEFQMCRLSSNFPEQSERLIAGLKTYTATSNIAALLDESIYASVHADYRTVTIWNLAQSSCEWAYKFTDFDHIQEIHWFCASNIPVLIVQFAYYVAVISPRSYNDALRTPSWTIHQVIQTRLHSSHIIGAVCCLSPNQIAVGVGNQIMTFEVSGIATVRTSTDMTLSPSVKAEQSIQLQNSSFAVYTPECLARFLAAGNLQLVFAVLEELHEGLRFLNTGGEIQFDTSQVLQKHDFRKTDFSDIKSNLKDYVTRVSEVQLRPQQKQSLQKLIDIADELAQNVKSMDQFALTYLYHFLQAFDKVESEDQNLQPLPYAAIVSASLSETQEALLNYILAILERRKISMTWSTARSLGIFLFVTDEETLKLYFESVARAEYNRNPDDKNPVDCSLHYLALNKKTILQSLWRRTVGVKEKESTMKLLARDFQDAKWKATALKNAYALLSRRRFEYAAAFFLLGGSLSDAVNVCINQLHDFQLAVAITRVWTGSTADKSKAMDNLIDKIAPNLAVHTPEARWILLWSRLQRRDWPGSIRCITEPVCQLLEKELVAAYADESTGDGRPKMPLEAMYSITNDPTLLINVYTYARQKLYDQGRWTADLVNDVDESKFVARSTKWYTRAGLDWIALSLMTEWKFLDVQKTSEPKVSSNGTTALAAVGSEVKSMLDDWMMPDMPTSTQQASSAQATSAEKSKPKPPPTQFVEPSIDSLLDSFGF